MLMGVTWLWNTTQASDMTLWGCPNFHGMKLFFICHCHNDSYNNDKNNNDDDDDENEDDPALCDAEAAIAPR